MMFGWTPYCELCKQNQKMSLGDHTDGNGKYYCRPHYRVKVQGASECPGCLGTTFYLPHGQPIRGKPRSKCPLCKGDGVLDSVEGTT